MSEFKYEFKNLCKSGQYRYSSAKVLFVDQFLDLLKIYGYVYITVPSKCRKVMMNYIWPEREQVIIEQCTENSNVSHGTISSSVSVVPD